MKILSVTAQKPNSTGSGIYLKELVKVFDDVGVRQAVIAGRGANDVGEDLGQISFYPIEYESCQLPFPVLGMSDQMPYKSTRYCDLSKKEADMFIEASLDVVHKAVEEIKPDIILCHHLYLLTAAIRDAFPDVCVAAVCHGTDLRQMEKHNLRRCFIRENIRGLNRIFALHQEQKKDIAHVYGADLTKISVIGCGYNKNIFKTDSIGRNKQGITFIYAGKISSKKGLLSLIHAYGSLTLTGRELVLRLAGGGEGADFDSIVLAASACENKVEFLGKLSQAELAWEFNRADVFVLPSFYEGLPLVVMEAMACGLKVVCTDLKGVRGWIGDNVKSAPVEYVPLPELKSVDEPIEAELPAFEKRLAAALMKAANDEGSRVVPDMSALSWEGLGTRVLEILKSDLCSQHKPQFEQGEIHEC